MKGLARAREFAARVIARSCLAKKFLLTRRRAAIERAKFFLSRNRPKPLKKPKSDEEIQGNPRKSKPIFPWFSLVFLGIGLDFLGKSWVEPDVTAEKEKTTAFEPDGSHPLPLPSLPALKRVFA